MHNIMKQPARITMFFFLPPQSFSSRYTRRRRADALRRRFPRVSISPRLSERSILVHLRMLVRPDYPQHSVFANGLHVVASFAPIVRWLRERHRDCCTLEVFVVNLETKDTFTGSVLLTQLQSRSFHSKDVQVLTDVTDIVSISTGTAVEQVDASTR